MSRGSTVTAAALSVMLACQPTQARITGSDSMPPSEVETVVIAAGDIAQCGNLGDEATAALVGGIDGTIAALGDNAYEQGSLDEYTNCYGPTWGRYKRRTRPALGNHEYETDGAAGHWDYWGDAAGSRGRGYYSYDLGSWHVVVLNSNCGIVSCAAGSEQERWLRADLAAHPATCTLAYFHHPLFSSGTLHGGTTAVRPLWHALYEAGADVILNAHEHFYERFSPQTPAGAADPAHGIRQFTVGTGGRNLYSFGTIKPNSEARSNKTLGVLKLSLESSSYRWQFVPVSTGSFADTGVGTCH